jgi:TPR repeat protein
MNPSLRLSRRRLAALVLVSSLGHALPALAETARQPDAAQAPVAKSESASTSGASAVAAKTGAAGTAAGTGAEADKSRATAPVLSKDAQRALDAYWESARCFRAKEDANKERGRKLLQEAASLELSQAQDFLGNCYLGGINGFPKDPRKGVIWLRLAAGRGFAHSKVTLAACLMEGVGISKDLRQAEQLLREALEPSADYSIQYPPAGYKPDLPGHEEAESTVSGEIPVSPADRSRAHAHYLLGEVYASQGKHAQSQAEYLLAVNQGENGRAGHFQAARKAALNYAYGRGVPRDSAKATAMVEASRQLMKRLGSAYARRLVESKEVDSFAQADVEDQLHKQGAIEERRTAMEIASSLSNRKSKFFNLTEAFRWLELAVEDGQGWAMISLGLLHLDPKAGKLDAAKARGLFKAAADKEGDPLAWGNYAICLQQGIGGPKDPDAAMKVFEKHQRYEILCRLGFVGRCPEAPMGYEGRNELMLKLAKKDDPQALCLLGLYLVYGVRNNEATAAGIAWLIKSAQLGHEEALNELGVLHQNFAERSSGLQHDDYMRTAVDYYRRAAGKRSISATVNLARCVQEGEGIRQDEDEALRLYGIVLEREPGNAMALNNMSQLYHKRYAESAMRLDETGMASMRGKMLELLTQADKQGLAMAARNLGSLNYEGSLGRKDLQAAYQHFDDAANRGDIFSRRMLGYMLEHGEGLPVSYAEAAYHYRIAALGGDTYALEQLCRFYRSGLGVSRDPERALHWLELAVKNGNVMARAYAADILLERGDAEAARKMLTEANGDQLAQRQYQAAFNHRMGLMYERGLGVARDPEKGRALRSQAYSAGDRDELHLRGCEMISEGRAAEAVPLLEHAIREGQTEAPFTLAKLFDEGTGVRKSTARAILLYKRAAANGNSQAKFILAQRRHQGFEEAPPLEEAILLAAEAQQDGVAGAAEIRADLEKRRAP